MTLTLLRSSAASPDALRPAARAAVALLAFVVYAAITFAIYGRALAQSWCCDDMQILLHAIGHSPTAYFADPPAWQALIVFSLTPWLSLAYDVDHALFGLDPRGYYLHALLAVALVAWLVDRLARRFVEPRFAAAAAIAFLIGAPIAQASQWLMARHYIEGAAAWLVAMLLAHRRLEQPTTRNAVGCGVAFAVAASAKEVFLPLGLLPLLVAGGVPWRARLRAIAPLLVVMALYVPWRWWMLGGLVGGYVPLDTIAGQSTASLIAQAAAVPRLLFAHPVAVVLAVTALLALAVWRSRVGLRAAAVTAAKAIVVVGLLVAPLLPLVAYPGIGPGSERFFIAPWVVFTLAVGALLSAAAAGGIRVEAAGWLLVAAIGALGWQVSGRVLEQTSAFHAEHRAHFDFVANQAAGEALFATPQTAAFFVEGALELRRRRGRSDPPPEIVVDEADLVGREAAWGRLWRWDAGRAALVPAGPGLAEMLANWRGSVREVSLSVDVRFDPGPRVVRWRFEPSAGGVFSLIYSGRRLRMPHAAGAVRVGVFESMCFRVRNDRADGTVAYSPWLALAIRDDVPTSVTWQGRSQPVERLIGEPHCPNPPR